MGRKLVIRERLGRSTHAACPGEPQACMTLHLQSVASSSPAPSHRIHPRTHPSRHHHRMHVHHSTPTLTRMRLSALTLRAT